MRLYNRLRFTLIAGLILTNPAQADYADGARAYDGGDYATAFTEWHRLAQQGDPEAQVSIASLYRGGIGRRVDLVQAAYWYSRAAGQGDAVAQMNLGEMYQHGWGVKRNRIEAYFWYDRAAGQGSDWATHQRDSLAKGMTEEALATAGERLRKNP